MTEWDEPMRRAIQLATSPDAPRSSNPRVGCVVLDASGRAVGEGYHRGSGTAHAEVVALQQAGSQARGGTAVVSLEPCSHVGRTGPCTAALIQSGVRRVVFAQSDPTERAGGGAQVLSAAGIEVVGAVLVDEATQVNRAWTHWQRCGRPLVTLKCAMSLDGRVAGPNGEPVAITGPAANQVSQRLRAEVDAVCIGAGTAMVDNPWLTARDPSGALRPDQPLRVVVGLRDLPSRLRLLDDAAPTLQIRSHDPKTVLAELADRGVQHVLLEGGPTLSAAFLEAGVVDEVMWWVAPRLLGSGPSALARLAAQVMVEVTAVDRVGDDVLVCGRIGPAAPGPAAH